MIDALIDHYDYQNLEFLCHSDANVGPPIAIVCLPCSSRLSGCVRFALVCWLREPVLLADTACATHSGESRARHDQPKRI